LQVLTAQTGAGGALLSPFEQIERQVVVVAEPVSNSLIVAATPKYFDEIKRLVEDLDKRPPMVLIQVLIAEVTLNDNDEFGVELGLQDGLLFQRGAPPNPGFLFNSATLGNDNVTENSQFVGGQSLTNFGVGRSTQAGFGGLVLSASSESVSVLIRALKTRQRIDVLARPQIQTLDNQTAYINVGQSVPQVRAASITQFGQTNSIEYINTGIVLGVTPRISPDGIVVMEIDANRSDVGSEADGIPISISNTGQILRAPRINQQLAQTTVSATDGQTVVLGGLISKNITEVHRQVPLLGDVPVVGHLFRYDAKTSERRELLIIMTPHVVRTNEDAEAVKRMEAGRMHWCLADVIELTGDTNLRGRKDDWPDGDTKVIYPDGDPRRLHDAPSPPPDRVPAPSPEPSRLGPPADLQKKTPSPTPGT
jgi:type II secretion system protein D